MTMDREQQNRVLAEAMGWRWGRRAKIAPSYPKDFLDGQELWWFENAPYGPSELPNYFTDPIASTQLRRKFRLCLVLGYVYVDGVLQDEREYWFAGPPNEVSARNLEIWPLAYDLDDLTAVAKAALALLSEA